MSHTWRRLLVVSRGSCVKESSALRGNFALGGKNCQAPASPPHQARLSLSHPEVVKVRVNKQSYISLENYVPNNQLKKKHNVWGPIFYDTATDKIWRKKSKTGGKTAKIFHILGIFWMSNSRSVWNNLVSQHLLGHMKLRLKVESKVKVNSYLFLLEARFGLVLFAQNSLRAHWVF